MKFLVSFSTHLTLFLGRLSLLAWLVFLVSSVIYCRYKKDVQVLHPVVEKVKGMKKALIPRNVTKLKSHLGFQNLNIVATFAVAVETQPILVLENQKANIN